MDFDGKNITQTNTSTRTNFMNFHFSHIAEFGGARQPNWASLVTGEAVMSRIFVT